MTRDEATILAHPIAIQGFGVGALKDAIAELILEVRRQAAADIDMLVMRSATEWGTEPPDPPTWVAGHYRACNKASKAIRVAFGLEPTR